MTDATVEDQVSVRLLEIFRAIFVEDVADISLTTERADIAAWDSMTHMRLVLAIEQAFNIKFDVRDIAKFDSISRVADIVREKALSSG